jgi:uncharacterized protein DUF3500
MICRWNVWHCLRAGAKTAYLEVRIPARKQWHGSLPPSILAAIDGSSFIAWSLPAMKYKSLIVVLILSLVAGSAGFAYFQAKSVGGDMTAQAEKYLASLSDEQRAKSLLEYDAKDPVAPDRLARGNWHFIPKAQRKGLQIKEMNESQRKTAHALLKSCLSDVGYDKATKIMELEVILRELEKGKGTNIRDPERYYFTVFGKPTPDGRWGLSVEGHHLSLNFVVEKGHVISTTPTMLGANPAIVKSEVPGGAKKGLRVLAKEEELAFDLFNSLSDEQRKVALIAEKAPNEIRAAGELETPQTAPAGIAADKLSDAQAKTLRALIEAYATNLPEEVSKARLTAIEKAGFGKIHFAWAGASKPGVGHYYRVQGPTFLIEFVNTQPDAAGNVANHIHCVWRDPAGDFAIPVAKK